MDIVVTNNQSYIPKEVKNKEYKIINYNEFEDIATSNQGYDMYEDDMLYLDEASATDIDDVMVLVAKYTKNVTLYNSEHLDEVEVVEFEIGEEVSAEEVFSPHNELVSTQNKTDMPKVVRDETFMIYVIRLNQQEVTCIARSFGEAVQVAFVQLVKDAKNIKNIELVDNYPINEPLIIIEEDNLGLL